MPGRDGKRKRVAKKPVPAWKAMSSLLDRMAELEGKMEHMREHSADGFKIFAFIDELTKSISKLKGHVAGHEDRLAYQQSEIEKLEACNRPPSFLPLKEMFGNIESRFFALEDKAQSLSATHGEVARLAEVARCREQYEARMRKENRWKSLSLRLWGRWMGVAA